MPVVLDTLESSTGAQKFRLWFLHLTNGFCPYWSPNCSLQAPPYMLDVEEQVVQKGEQQ